MGNRGSSPGRSRDWFIHHSVQTTYETHPPSLPSESGHEVKLTTHLKLVPSFKNFWSYTCTPSSIFIARSLIKDNQSWQEEEKAGISGCMVHSAGVKYDKYMFVKLRKGINVTVSGMWQRAVWLQEYFVSEKPCLLYPEVSGTISHNTLVFMYHTTWCHAPCGLVQAVRLQNCIPKIPSLSVSRNIN